MKEPRATDRLSKSDWISVGLRMLAAEGIEAVQVTRLADDLGVTRGSFYWHFKNRDDLLNDMIGKWRSANSGVMADALKDAASLTGGILALFSIWVEDEKFSPVLDQAMRDWARLSQHVADIVRKEDGERIRAIAGFLERMEIESGEATVRARVIYFTQIGYYALNMDDPMAARLDMLDHYFRIFTGREIDQALAAAFRQHHLHRSGT